MSREPSPVRGAIATAVILAVFCGVIAFFSALSTVPQSDVGFQTGGGFLDPSKNRVKSDLLKPGRHVTGTFDGMWKFPAYKTLRFEDFEVPVTTIDGKKTLIAGQVGFRFVGEQDPALARQFAEGIGSRKYGGERPGENDEGWSNMLTQLVDPEINATLKDGFGRVFCADFEPACRAIDPRKDVPQSEPEVVYDTVSKALQERVDQKLGASYLREIRVRVARITLQPEVQRNIDAVTAEQARTKAAQQSEQTASAEARAIKTKAEALRENKQLIAVEVAKACKGGDRCTIIVDGSGRGVMPSVPAR